MAFNISPFYNHKPGHVNSKKVRESRGGNTTYVTGEQGNYSFYDSPQYDDHQPSSHLMADDNKKGAWPSIYRDSLGNWSNQNKEQAIKRNELYNFNTNEDMTNFARVGNWKKSTPLLVRKTKEGLALKRWFKEKWETPSGKKDYSKTNENTFRPTVKVSKDTPSTWNELTSAEKAAARKEKNTKGRVSTYKKKKEQDK
tara:strand:+ start:81 stop:674 length:594 start_codon:yes stop_codon:yes gene_type:complete